MPLPVEVQIGSQLALSLASIYLPGSGQAVSALAAVYAAVQAYNAQAGKPDDHVPTREEWDAFIAGREAKRIDRTMDERSEDPPG